MQTAAKEKRLIVNADDFGFSPGVTEGILRAHREGIVTSTTVMANLSAAAEAIARLGEAPDLGVGVHLNASQGPPLSGQAILAGESGRMDCSAKDTLLRCLLRRGFLDALEREFDAQIRWVLDHGIRPTHLDSHRHAHAFPPIFLRVAKLARRYRIGYVRWHREVLAGRWPAPIAPKQDRTRRQLNCFGQVNALIAPDLRGSAGTWGIAHTGVLSSAWLIRALAALRPGVTEFMVHPGLVAGLDASLTRLLASREEELRALCDPAVRQELRRQGVTLTHYGRLV